MSPCRLWIIFRLAMMSKSVRQSPSIKFPSFRGRTFFLYHQHLCPQAEKPGCHPVGSAFDANKSKRENQNLLIQLCNSPLIFFFYHHWYLSSSRKIGHSVSFSFHSNRLKKEKPKLADSICVDPLKESCWWKLIEPFHVFSAYKNSLSQPKIMFQCRNKPKHIWSFRSTRVALLQTLLIMFSIEY